MTQQEVREYIALIVLQLNKIIDNLLIDDVGKWLLFTQETCHQLDVCQDMVHGAREAMKEARTEKRT